MKFDGGYGGQNGLCDIVVYLGYGKYYCLCIGIGYLGYKDWVMLWVLGKLLVLDEDVIFVGILCVLDVLLLVVVGQFDKVMQQLYMVGL